MTLEHGTPTTHSIPNMTRHDQHRITLRMDEKRCTSHMSFRLTRINNEWSSAGLKFVTYAEFHVESVSRLQHRDHTWIRLRTTCHHCIASRSVCRVVSCRVVSCCMSCRVL